MKIVLATSNSGKLREFKQMCQEEVVAFSELLGHLDIIEDGESFAQNATIKARTIYEKLQEQYPSEPFIVISDDSGISLPLLGGSPGIYSARYAGEGATDKANLAKLLTTLQAQGVTRTPAYYTAAIAIISDLGEYVVHGWMHGDAIDHARGEKGFGYDPMFIPTHYTQTLGELDDPIKATLSHRAQALTLAKPIIQMLQRSAS